MTETVTTRNTRVIHPSTIAIENQASPGATIMRRSRRRGAERRSDSATVATDALVDALAADSTIEIADDFDIVPTTEAKAGRRERAGAPTQIEIEVEQDERVAVLIESDGVYAWKFPAEDESRRRRVRGKELHTLVVTIDVAQDEDGGGKRGRRGMAEWFSGQIKDRIRAIVVKFIAGKAVTAAQRYLERNINPGLIEIRGNDIANWVAGDAAPDVALPKNRPARILLMIHGTFSSTQGSFGSLAAMADGRSFLEDAARQYDAILAYDHATLGETPQENATAILEALRKLSIRPGSTVDIVAFSRGGLIARLLVERMLGASGWLLTPEKVVFVGCTNGGTALADQDNWKVLLDLYTNLAVAAGKGMALLGAGISGVIVTESIKTLSTFMQAIVDSAVTEEMVPGIAAMSPKNPLVNELNDPEAAIDDKAVSYFAIGSNFEPSFKQDDTGTSLPTKLMRALADLGVDQLMGEANDLVVDNEAMTQFGAYGPRLEDRIIWGENAVVFHTNYFTQPDVARAIHGWLTGGGAELALETFAAPGADELGALLDTDYTTADEEGAFDWSAGAGGGDSAEEAEADWSGSADAPPPSPDRRRAKQNSGLGRATRRSPASAPAPRPSMDREEAPPPAAAAEVECHFAAEMAKSVPLGETADLTVTVSREEIEEAAGKVFGTASAMAEVGEPIEIEVRARANCTIEGPHTETVRIPDPGKPGHYDFKVKGKRAGTAEIWVDARQGARRLARIVLQPEFTASGTIRAAAVVNTAEDDPPTVELRIYEHSDGPNLPFSLRFVMQSRDLDINIDEETPRFPVSREAYIASLYRTLEGEWGADRGFEQFMARLRAFGADLYEYLVPEEIREVLWANRDKIGSIEVISHEPFIPWEVLHIVEPGKKLPIRGNKFLAELGLVRWISNIGWPPASLTIRRGRAKHVIPDYADPRNHLAGAARERGLVTELFDSAAVPGDSLTVSEMLQEPGAFDLIHFACHGAAEEERIWDASLLMAGTRNAETGRVTEDTLTVSQIDQYASLRADDGSRPMVFLNACQTGKAGYTLAGTGGMAEAFVRNGAGLFVGTLWSIGDDTALTFARTFYEAMRDGATVTAATRAARQASKKADEPTWLAYTVYGHPYARITMEGG